MNNKLFGSLGDKLKGNSLIFVLVVAVIAAGTFSYVTINDINQKLNEQQIHQIETTPTPSPSPESEVKDTQNEQQNIPLPTSKPSSTPTPNVSSSPQDTTPEEVVVKFKMPVDGKVYAAFSGNELVYNRSLDDWRTHNGIDISATKDAAVYAVKNGVVTDIYEDGLLGNIIEIDHTDYTARYCGLNTKTFVKKGDTVTQGQSIGSIGEIPLEIIDEPHLHFEVLIAGSIVNPETIMK